VAERAEAVVERTALQRAQRIFLLVLAALLLVLVATGTWLTVRYQPSGSFEAAHPESWVRVAHRVTSIAFLGAAVLTFGVSIAVSYERRLRRGVPAWVPGFVLLLGAATAGISGYLLPWDQLALTAVKVDVSYRGFGWLFGESDVKFVLIGAVEVSKSSMRTSFVFHTILMPVALVVLGVVLFRVTRRKRLLPPEPYVEPTAASPS
jgi:quinol-cytochrome oxidoreductase complex cytochrome b subunit